ncbi:MAG: hypothetical protein IPF52_03915 [Saprospiraceae bacterium]|nr:hypothetical protein [Saprospiraceae bacterium]MBK7524206.1 hypothetical protein [Saprospiraceae bacterium]MBP6693649.1 hypothetical protein [Saprospiraceae bacterium]
MKSLILILTILYSVVAIYTAYMAIIHLFVYFANQRLGHTESFRLPLIYLTCALLFGTVSFIGYKLFSGGSSHFLLKTWFYLPATAVGLYVLWAILLVFSSGGKWN